MMTLPSLQGICTPHPRFIALPGSSVTDIPVPDYSPNSGYAVLVPFLQQQSRAVDRVLGDGNCLFRALSVQLTSTQDYHLELRKAIALFEQRNEAVFRCLHETIARSPFSDHLRNIKKSCVWGTTVEILAFSSLFQVDVYVASDTYHHNKVSWVKYSPRVSPASLTLELQGFTFSSHLNMQKEWVEILHVSRSHFDAIKPSTDASLARPILEESSVDIDLE